MSNETKLFEKEFIDMKEFCEKYVLENKTATFADAFKAFNEKTSEVATEVATENSPIKVRLTSPKTVSSKDSPSIKGAKNCSQAVLKLLETEWGAWRPRTLSEIVEALKDNAIHYPASTLSGVLSWLVKRGKVRRWKTDAGYVYILPEKEGR